MQSSVFDPSSPFARATVGILNVTLIISGIVFTLVTVLVIYCIIRFKGGVNHPDPQQITGHKTLEIVWTAIPLLTVMYLFFLTAHAMKASDPPNRGDPDIIVIGHQYWWEVRYPKSGAVTANEIHIPAGKPLLFQVRSVDVIHNFWVPQLGRKMDIMPEYTNRFWIQADKPGDYHGVCAEFCGLEHAWMRLLVVAQAPEEFAAWEQRQLQPAPTPVNAKTLNGQKLFEQLTCINCHNIRGLSGDQPLKAGPDLTHLGSRQTLGAGRLKNTPEDLANWIKEPQKIKPGNLMPNMLLTEAQTEDLLAYLQTLK